MSWLSDGASKVSKGFGKTFSKMSEYSVPGLAMKAAGMNNAISDFYEREFVDKADLRGAEAVSFASGLPIVGGIVRGVEGVNQLEDLYNNTGKVPEYPGSSGPSAQGLASAATGISRKIEEGSHDLGEYYSGDTTLDQFPNVNGKHIFSDIKEAPPKRISKYGGF